jgi:hypothetical protein
MEDFIFTIGEAILLENDFVDSISYPEYKHPQYIIIADRFGKKI